MKVELVQDVVDGIKPFTIPVYVIEGFACSFNRQCRYVESFAVGRNSRDPRSDAKANVVQLTQLLYHTVDLLGIHPLRIQDRLCVVEDYQDLF